MLVVERWILARLRNRRFFSLTELNQAIAELVADLNARPMRKLGVSRRDLFLELDRRALKELPAEPYQYAEWRVRRVGLDYHVDIDGHYYSVPHRLIREQLDARITERAIEFVLQGRAGCGAHARRRPRAAHDNPRAHAERTPALCRVDDRAHWHRCGGNRPEQADGIDPGEPAAPRAGIPRLHRHFTVSPALRRRAAGSGLQPWA